MVNNISNIRGFKFHKELSISHHTQFLDKGGLCPNFSSPRQSHFTASSELVRKLWLAASQSIFILLLFTAADVNTYLTMSFLLPRALLWFLANRFVNICLKIPVIWGNISECVLRDIFHNVEYIYAGLPKTDSISLIGKDCIVYKSLRWYCPCVSHLHRMKSCGLGE